MSQLSCWLLTVYAWKYATSLCTQKSVGGLFGRFIDKRVCKSGTRIGVRASIQLFGRTCALYLIYYAFYALLLPSSSLTNDRL